jgi:tripartite ATP-independent transporter DctP family solute receptor
MQHGLSITHQLKLRFAAACIALFIAGSPAFAQTTLMVAHQNEADSIIGIAFERMAELAEEHSEGDLELEIHHGGVLGQERELVEQAMGGVLDIVIASPGPLGVFEPSFSILALPFIYEDDDHVRAVVDGPIMDEINNRLIENAGVRILTTGFPGFRYTYTKGTAIRSLEDFQGLRIRVPPSDVHVATFRALGANPTPIAFGEIYTSLQTGVVDGMENINEYVYTPSLHEQLDYAARTRHMFEPWAILMNEARWNRLSADQQDALSRAATEAWEEQREAMDERNAMFEERLRETGMEFIEIERQPLLEATEGVRSSLVEEIEGGQELLKAILEAGN